MAYDERLAGRVRAAVSKRSGIEEKRMFGGLCFLLRKKMFSGVVGDELMARVGPAAYARALTEPHVRPMDFTGRPLAGYVYVGAAGCSSPSAVRKWVEKSTQFVETLPDKPPKSKRKQRPAAARKPANRGER